MNTPQYKLKLVGRNLTVITNETPKRIFTGEYDFATFFGKRYNGKEIDGDRLITNAINLENYKILQNQDSMVVIFSLQYWITITGMFTTKPQRENHILKINMTHTSYDYDSLEIPTNLIPLFDMMQQRIETLEKTVKHLHKMSMIDTTD